MIYIIYFLTFSFLLLAIIIYTAFVSVLKKQTLYNTSIKLSIIIAAKNEEKNINSLIESLEELNYPKESYEVIIVDDNSTDKTYSTIQSLISGKDNYKLISADHKKLDGKKGALTIGIEHAKYNFIVITDADCKPGINWLKAIAGKLAEGFDFVFGVAPISSGITIIQKFSAFENLRNSFLTISALGLNVPYSAAARSFAFKKSSFKKIGGYSNTAETISGDDDLLLREAVKNKMLIGSVIDPEAFVYSEAPKTFNEYLKQKKRHLQTSFHYLPKQKIFLGFWHLINLISLFSVVLVFISPVFALPFAVKLIYDFIIAIRIQEKLGHSFKFYEVIYLQLIFEFFIVVNFFNSLSGKPEWK